MSENVSIPLSANGTMREFGNGCHRDDATGKGRCDWMPLYVVANIMRHDDFIKHIAEFLEDFKPKHLEDALRMLPNVFKEYTSVPQMMIEVSKLYEAGAIKYGANNWQRGMPLWCYIDSGVRHYFKTIRGDDDEPHYRGVVWNLLGALWTIDNIPESVDKMRNSITCKIKQYPAGEGRCDLLPLEQVCCLMDDDDVLHDMGVFIKRHTIEEVYDAIDVLIDGQNRADVMLALAKIYEVQGKEEYFGARGWENLTLIDALNQALKCYFSELDSGKDHLETIWWLMNVICIAKKNPEMLKKLGEKE